MVKLQDIEMIVPQKSFDTNDSFQMFLDEEKSWMYDRIFEAIMEAFMTGQKKAHILEAKIEDTMSVIAINSDMAEWVTSLDLARVWYESVERYEDCAAVRDLIKSIQERKPTRRRYSRSPKAE